MITSIERPKTLKQQALDTLRDAITTGHFKPGERLVERALCEQMGVSRTVIRECIRHLESEKLVHSLPNVGPTVASLSEQNVREIYTIRRLLESQACSLAADNIDPESANQLAQHMRDIAASLKDNNVDQAIAITSKLYQQIFALAEMELSWELISSLNARITRLRKLSLSNNQRLIDGPKSLQKLIDSICKGKASAARDICETHLRNAEESCIKQYRASNP